MLSEAMQQCMEKEEYQPRWWMWANLRLTAEELIDSRVYGRTRTRMFHIPPTCRLLLLLKNCYVDGVDWIRPGCLNHRISLLSLRITEIEVVEIGNMRTGATGYVTAAGVIDDKLRHFCSPSV